VADLLGLIGFGSFLAVSLAVGLRLLWLARATRRLPELAIGLDLVLAGAVGYGLLLASESLRLLPAPYDGWGSFAGVTAISLGSACLAWFTRRVFRPASAAAHIAFVALVVGLALGIYGSWALHIERATAGAGRWLGTWAPNLGLCIAYAWAAFEPLRYRARLRRRARVGIETGDPLATNRMLLWGLGTGAIAAIALLHLVAQLFGRHQLPPSLVSVVSLLALTAAVSEWLAFFPPRGYTRRFARAHVAG
jgi:hypothetical protein